MKQIFQLINRNMTAESAGILEKALERRLSERGCALQQSGFTIAVRVDHDLKEGEYRVMPSDSGVEIVAGDDCAVFAGIGHYLVRSSFSGQGGFEPCADGFAFIPEREIRGIYFASHFANFYHVAPMEKVYEQIEDIALRGGNAIAAWYDMHHYTSIDDPDSIQMIARIKQIYNHARKIGMKTCFCTLSNESFAGSPKEMRAESKPQNGYFATLDGHYGVEICPSRPGGIEEIIRQRRIVLKAFADSRPDYIEYWPYDQGGCTCEKCAPWGVNGFLRIMPHFVKVVREELPGTRLICSTWYFDKFCHGEWEAFWEKANNGAIDDMDYLMDFFPRGCIPDCVAKKGFPAGKKMLAFPEISMYGGQPWGGFGANPLPAFLQESNDKGMPLYAGQFCYSEGIFEDINKTIMLDACSGREKNACQSLADYIRFEFCTEDAGDIVRLSEMLERTLDRTVSYEENTIRYIVKQPEEVKAAEELADAIDARLSDAVRRGWRWRILYLRAKIDAALMNHDWAVTPDCDRFMEELRAYYYVCDQTLPCVNPPTSTYAAQLCENRARALKKKG